jgi:hypothetical protein
MSGGTSAWEQRARATRGRLQPLEFLVGDFFGDGTDHGEPIRARATGRLLLDGSWLELGEQILDPQGAVVHRDLALYRWDPAEQGLRVLHLMDRAWLAQYPVHLDAAGRAAWTTGVGGPVVILEPCADGWTSSVRLPDEAEPSVRLRYRRIGSEG